MREAYKLASEEERIHLDNIGRGAEAINELDQRYKAAKESLGQYQDSVGNYGKVLDGFSGNLQSINTAGIGLAQTFLSATGVIGLFGDQSEDLARKAQGVQKVLTVLNMVQKAHGTLLKQVSSSKVADATATKVQTEAIKEQTVATEVQTVATKGWTKAVQSLSAAFKAFIANPIVAVFTAVAAAATAMYLIFKDQGEKAVESYSKQVKKLREEHDRLNTSIEYTAQLMRAGGATSIEVAEYEYNEATELSAKAYAALARGQNRMENLPVFWSKKKMQENLDELQAVYDEASAKASAAFRNLQVVRTQAETDAEKQADEDAKQAGKDAADRAKLVASSELEAIRKAEDERNALIEDSFTRQIVQTRTNYARQIEDLRTRLATENTLTETAREAINDTILSLTKKGQKEIEQIQRNAADSEKKLMRDAEDSRIRLIEDGYEQQRVKTEIQYRRLREDLEQKLAEDKSLTAEGRAAIQEVIDNSYAEEVEAQRNNNTNRLNAQIAADNSLIDEISRMLDLAEQKIGEVTVRQKGGLKLIDVQATKQNLADSNAALQKFVDDMRAAQEQQKASHEAMLATVSGDEYEAEVKRYGDAWFLTEKEIAIAEKKIVENTEDMKNISIEAIKEFMDELSEELNKWSTAITDITDSLKTIFEVQLDDLNVQLDEVSKRYDDIVDKREKSTEQLMRLEEKLKTASGGTADALKQQLADEMANRNELLREEKRIAKEKERLDAQIAKKEKQIKRATLVSNIAMGIANTAQAITNALTIMFPLNLIVAGIVGVMGAVSTGIMARQLTKLAKGGEIVGPSHSAGGVPIPGTNYEAEGGEFVTNKTSYAANENLVRYINSSDRALTLSDLAGVVPDNPLAAAMVTQSRDDAILSAIEGIDFQPQVAVTEIESVQKRMVTVRELSGFSS